MTTARTLNISNIQRDIFYAALVVLVSLMGLYVYFLTSSMINVAVRQSVNEQVASLSSKVASLEFRYVTLQNSVTNDVANARGFVTSSPVAYVTKDTGLSFAR